MNEFIDILSPGLSPVVFIANNIRLHRPLGVSLYLDLDDICKITFQTLDIVESDQVDNERRREYELSDVLDYIKTGVEAIIEDQVTSRFEAQELKVNILFDVEMRYFNVVTMFPEPML